MSQALAVYDIFQGTQVRKVDRGDSKVWRVFADCCKALGFQGKPSNQLKRIPKQHTDLIGLLAQDGRTRKQWVINEEGLIALIAYSRLPKEKLDAFRELIGKRATAPVSTDVIQALMDRIEKLERGGGHLLIQPIPDILPRARLNMIIRKFVARQTGGYSYPDAWRELHFQNYYRYHVDLKARARKRDLDPLDCATPQELEDLVNLANHIFTEN